MKNSNQGFIEERVFPIGLVVIGLLVSLFFEDYFNQALAEVFSTNIDLQGIAVVTSVIGLLFYNTFRSEDSRHKNTLEFIEDINGFSSIFNALLITNLTWYAIFDLSNMSVMAYSIWVFAGGYAIMSVTAYAMKYLCKFTLVRIIWRSTALLFGYSLVASMLLLGNVIIIMMQ